MAMTNYSSSSRKSPFISNEVLRRYFDEIRTEKTLTPDEEIELARKVKAGDTQALDRLLKANLRFVVSVAKKYQGYGLSLADIDLMNGNYRLIKRARR